MATGFPSGQFPLSTRLEEIRLAVSAGAREIDIVINRQLALENKWQELFKSVNIFNSMYSMYSICSIKKDMELMK